MSSSFAIVASSLFLLSTSVAQAQSLIASQDFEGADMVGYSTLGGSFALNGADYLQRGTNGAPFLFEQPVTGFSGSHFIGLEDIDGAGLVDPHWLALNAITVTGYTSLSVSLLVAAPSLLATRYETEDFLIVEYSLDGAGFTVLGRFVGGPGGGPLMHDTNLDGVGDVSIGAAMQRYTYGLGGAVGSSLVVRVRFSSAGSQEEMAFDDIRITGVPPVASTCGNGVREGAEVCDDGFTGACGACNATCTAAGTGSTCGDGVLCSESETCDDGATDVCGACNATCKAPGTGSPCDAGGASGGCDGGAACDAGSQSAIDAGSQSAVDAGSQSAVDAGSPNTVDAGGQNAVDACSVDCQGDSQSADAGAVSQPDACSGDCLGDAASTDAVTASASDACGSDCPGASQSSEASVPDAGESGGEDEDEGTDEDEGADEETTEDTSAIEGADAGTETDSGPRKRHGDGCSVAASPSASGLNPLLLALALLARRRFARRDHGAECARAR